MNDNLADLEDELRRLRPAEPSKELERRVAILLEVATSSPGLATWWQRLGFSRPSAAFAWGLLSPALTAAAVVACTRFHAPWQPSGPQAGARGPAGQTALVPQADHAALNPPPGAVHATNVLYKTQDDGVVLDGTREPVHRVRYRSADLVQWRNPNTGARWEVSYPREDVALVPIRID